MAASPRLPAGRAAVVLADARRPLALSPVALGTRALARARVTA